MSALTVSVQNPLGARGTGPTAVPRFRQLDPDPLSALLISVCHKRPAVVISIPRQPKPCPASGLDGDPMHRSWSREYGANFHTKSSHWSIA